MDKLRRRRTDFEVLGGAFRLDPATEQMLVAPTEGARSVGKYPGVDPVNGGHLPSFNLR